MIAISVPVAASVATTTTALKLIKLCLLVLQICFKLSVLGTRLSSFAKVLCILDSILGSLRAASETLDGRLKLHNAFA
jgi:hypothetical protein